MKVIHKEDLQQITFLDERFYFDEKTETYQPAVTNILNVYPKGYGFMQWLKDVGSNADIVLKRAQEKGSKIHDGIERFLNGEEIKWTEDKKENFTLDEWMMMIRFFDFYKTYKPEPLGIEVSLVSPELGFGGTLDLICKMKGKIWYIDWKSGNAIHKTNKIQVAAYVKLWNSKMDEKIERAGLLHLRASTRGADKSGKKIQGEGWKLDEVEDINHMYKLFEHAHAIWKEENPNPKPKNLVYPDRIKL